MLSMSMEKTNNIYDSEIIPRRKKISSRKNPIFEIFCIIAGLSLPSLGIAYLVIWVVILNYQHLDILGWIWASGLLFALLFVLTTVIMGEFVGTNLQQIIITNKKLIVKYRSLISQKPDKIIPLTKATTLYSNENSKFPAMVFIYQTNKNNQKQILLLFKDHIPNLSSFLQILHSDITVDSDTFCNYAIAKKLIQYQKRIPRS